MRPVLCLITDRRRFGPAWQQPLVEQVGAAAGAGIDLVQVREPDLAGAALLSLVRDCLDAVGGTRTRVVVNDRLDVAMAAGAHGVHLRADSMPAEHVRRVTGRPFLVGRSVHAVDEATAVSESGAVDYLLFGTVFESASKPGRAPAGLTELERVAQAVRIPVLGVGGVNLERLAAVGRTGAAGWAGIGLFADTPAEELREIVQESTAAFDTPVTPP